MIKDKVIVLISRQNKNKNKTKMHQINQIKNNKNRQKKILNGLLTKLLHSLLK